MTHTPFAPSRLLTPRTLAITKQPLLPGFFLPRVTCHLCLLDSSFPEGISTQLPPSTYHTLVTLDMFLEASTPHPIISMGA